MDSYFLKYLKYKNKYLSLRNLYGGVDPEELTTPPAGAAGTTITPPMAAAAGTTITPPMAAMAAAGTTITPPPTAAMAAAAGTTITPPTAETIQSEQLSIKLAQSIAAANEVITSRRPSLMLLSEIANYTKKIYFSNNKIELITELPPLLNQFNRIPDFLNDETKYMTCTGFCQDDMIQLYDTTTTNYINLIHHNAWKDPIMTENHSIDVLKLNNITMIGDKTIDELISEIGEMRTNLRSFNEITRLKQSGMQIIYPPTQIISLPLHDIFFPLENNYINIHLHNENRNIGDFIHEPRQLIKSDFTTPNPATSIKLSEQIKGGNFIASPPTLHAPHGVLFCINPITEQMLEFLQTHLLQPVIQLPCSFMYFDNVSVFRHIDEIMTFLPYGKDASGRGRFKVWFYDIIAPPQSTTEPSASMNIPTDPMVKSIYDSRKRIYDEELIYNRDVIPRLRDEQRRNLNIISNALFRSDYQNNTDKFFIIPINVGYPPHLFPLPPIFNSTYIETIDGTIPPKLFLSSWRDHDVLDKKIIDELTKLRSIITGREVQWHILNTIDLHNNPLKIPGGNLHCLIKQEMEFRVIE